jgi:anti-anti-sigma factor
MSTIDRGPLAGPASLVPLVELDVDGDLDVTQAIELSEQLEDALRVRPQRLVIRLDRCPHLDAQVVRVLLDAHRALWETGGRLILSGCRPETSRLLDIMGLADVFEIESSGAFLDQAVLP